MYTDISHDCFKNYCATNNRAHRASTSLSMHYGSKSYFCVPQNMIYFKIYELKFALSCLVGCIKFFKEVSKILPFASIVQCQTSETFCCCKENYNSKYLLDFLNMLIQYISFPDWLTDIPIQSGWSMCQVFNIYCLDLLFTWIYITPFLTYWNNI